MHAIHRSAVPWMAIALAAAGGCGPGLGTVEGMITFEGVPVTEGFVMLYPTNGRYRESASVRVTGGRYRLERVALGEKTLALQDLAIQDASSGAVKPVPADALGAPATIVVEAGRQTLDLELRRLGISEDY
ncbi:MAG: hypothetical protein EBS56_10905 [Planctomycetia bacterium]|nr:hypothetical protein [Planctomycetia bacterium]